MLNFIERFFLLLHKSKWKLSSFSLSCANKQKRNYLLSSITRDCSFDRSKAPCIHLKSRRRSYLPLLPITVIKYFVSLNKEMNFQFHAVFFSHRQTLHNRFNWRRFQFLTYFAAFIEICYDIEGSCEIMS